MIGEPRLIATFRPGAKAAKVGKLPPAADIAKLAAELRASGKGGRPTAVVPIDEELAAMAERFAFRKPSWMSDWQWQRVRELAEAGGQQRDGLTAETPFWYQYIPPHVRNRLAGKAGLSPRRAYDAWVDEVLSRQMRGWHGFEGAEVILPWALYRDAMCEPMKDHWRLYWTAWLMPDFAITLSAQKMIADFGPEPFDRLIGRTILAKSVDELASAYHPGLRRFVAGSARTSLEHILATQDGAYHIVHTLSKRGVLHGVPKAGESLPAGMPAIGHEVPPLRVANQTLAGPWAPEWLAETVDDKPLPFEMTAAFTQWGGYKQHPLWRRTYLGRHYGLYSSDNGWGFTQLLGQWRRADRPVEHMAERATMFLRYGVNDTQLVNMAPGWIRHFGCEATLHNKGRMLVVASPYAGAVRGEQGVRSLQTTAAFFNYESPRPSWRVLADGKPVEKLPAIAPAGRPILIQDGVTCIGLIPLPATDLGRDAEVVLREGVPQEFGKIEYRPALLVESLNRRAGSPLDKAADWAAVDKAYGGFVVEFSDASEYADFDAFRRHIEAAKLQVRWQADANTVHVRYDSGADAMEAGVRTDYREDQTTDKLFAYRRVNGAWPYLPEGVFRDTPYAVQSATGRLAKGGAVLTCQKGRMAYLQALPGQGVFAGYNPFPEPTDWRLDVPGGVSLRAEGKLGLAHVVIRPAAGELTLDYALRVDQAADAAVAKSLLVFGLTGPPKVMLNGKPLAAPPWAVDHPDGKAWRVPIVSGGAEK